MADSDAFFNKLRNKGFMTKPQEDGAYTLVHPSRGKYDWEPDELSYRSVIFDASGNVVSTGWPKFFNQGEWAETDAAIAGELEAGRAVITHKHDGSLIIRSVLPGGRILFRTRDTFAGGKFAPLAEAVARAKYPCLLNPTFFAHGSLLFEYVGAGNQIVVRYEGGDDLILLGAGLHEGTTVRYLPFPDVEAVAQANGLRAVEVYDWADAKNGVGEILSLVQGWDKAEGVVVRSGDGQTLLKVKSAWYFAQHALRWHMTYEAICRFAIDGGIVDETSLSEALQKAGWDYETTVTAREHFARYLKKRAEADDISGMAWAFVGAFDGESSWAFSDERQRRKAFAARVYSDPETKALAPYLFYAYDGKAAQLDSVLLRKVVLKG
ncbi:MAG: hypothetical protein H8F28_13025 [Fibrella sp.]|nr:hypothetical protein [Armatimonadota bacterium]